MGKLRNCIKKRWETSALNTKQELPQNTTVVGKVPQNTTVVGKSDQEDAVVGKSDQEDVENSHTLSCVNCDAEMTPDHQCDSDEQRFTKYLMRWSQRLEERTDDSALKSRLLESLVDAYHTPELASWHTPVSALHLKAVKNQFLEGVVTPVRFLEELQNLLTNPS